MLACNVGPVERRRRRRGRVRHVFSRKRRGCVTDPGRRVLVTVLVSRLRTNSYKGKKWSEFQDCFPQHTHARHAVASGVPVRVRTVPYCTVRGTLRKYTVRIRLRMYRTRGRVHDKNHSRPHRCNTSQGYVQILADFP